MSGCRHQDSTWAKASRHCAPHSFLLSLSIASVAEPVSGGAQGWPLIPDPYLAGGLSMSLRQTRSAACGVGASLGVRLVMGTARVRERFSSPGACSPLAQTHSTTVPLLWARAQRAGQTWPLTSRSEPASGDADDRYPSYS